MSQTFCPFVGFGAFRKKKCGFIPVTRGHHAYNEIIQYFTIYILHMVHFSETQYSAVLLQPRPVAYSPSEIWLCHTESLFFCKSSTSWTKVKQVRSKCGFNILFCNISEFQFIYVIVYKLMYFYFFICFILIIRVIIRRPHRSLFWLNILLF